MSMSLNALIPLSRLYFRVKSRNFKTTIISLTTRNVYFVKSCDVTCKDTRQPLQVSQEKTIFQLILFCDIDVL